LNSGYQLIKLEQDPSSLNILFPATINQTSVALFLSTNSDKLLLDKSAADKLDLQITAMRGQQLHPSLGCPNLSAVSRARLQQLVTGNGANANLQRYPDIRVATLGPRIKVTKEGREILVSGYLGLEFLEQVGPVIDFHHKVLAIPNTGESSGAYAYRQAQAGAIPTTIIRDSKSGQYFIVLAIQRKQFAFQIDLNGRSHQITPLIAKQLNLKISQQDGISHTTLNGASIDTFPLTPVSFELVDQPTAPVRVGGFRYAGVLSIPFFVDNQMILDFGGPLAVIPQETAKK
jgi:hypothetical protein